MPCAGFCAEQVSGPSSLARTARRPRSAAYPPASCPALPRSLKLAPKRYVDNAKGMFLPHSPQAQEAAMRTYAAALLQLPAAVCCQGCKEELELAGIDMRHLAALLFASETGQVA